MRQNQISVMLRWLLVLGFLAYVFVHFLKVVQPVLIYHLQQPPFYKMQVFFSQYTDYPGGMAEYAGNFLAQLLHSNFMGSLLLVTSMLVLMLVAKYVFSQTRGGGKGFFWMILPVVLLSLLFQNYYFPYYVFLKVFIAYCAVAIFIALRNRRTVQMIFFGVMVFTLYYLAGSTALLIFLASVIVYASFSSFTKVTPRIIFIIVALVVSVAVPYLGYKYLFNISQLKIWWDLVPAQPVIIRYVPDKALYAFVAVLPVVLLICGLLDKIKSLMLRIPFINRLYSRFSSSDGVIMYLGIIVVAAGLYIVIRQWVFTSLNTQKKSVLLVDYYMLHGEWDKAIDAALSSNEYDLFINFNYNRSVYNSGKWGEWFFKYPQLLGADGLFPDKIVSGQVALVASNFYYELGYISEALHWAFEAQSTTPYNPLVLQRLVKVHLIEGKPEAAATYLNILKTAFFQDDFVKKYSAYIRDTSLIGKDPEFLEKRSFMPRNTYTPGTISEKLKLLIKFNGNNRRALEYLAMYYLLSHQVGNFANILPQVVRYYNPLPTLYQEALVLYVAKTDAGIRYAFKEDVIQSVKNFFENFKKYPDRRVAQNALQQDYLGTYLYYVAFQSPVVTKMQLKAREVESY